MKTQITPRLKKALLASMSILTLSFTCSSVLADNEIYDSKTVNFQDFSNQSLKASTWVDANLIRVDFTNANLSNANFSTAHLWHDVNFSGANLSRATFANARFDLIINFSGADLSGVTFANAMFKDNVDLNTADLSGADFRKADTSGARNLDFNAHNNIIYTNGQISNLTLSSADDALMIRGVEDANAYLSDTTATISNGATLTLTQNAVLELTTNTQLTLAAGGNLSFIIDTSTPNNLTSIVIKSGSSLTLDPGAILDITIENFVGDEMEFNILSWENDADVAELLAQLNSGASLRINDQLGYTGTIDYATKTFSVSYIPEPSTASLSLLALTVMLARRRRKAA